MVFNLENNPTQREDNIVKSATPTIRNKSSVPALGYYHMKPLFLFIWSGRINSKDVFACSIAKDVLEARRLIMENTKDHDIKECVNTRAPRIANKQEMFCSIGKVEHFSVL